MSAPPVPQRVPVDPADAKRHAATVRELLEASVARAGTFSEEQRNRRVNDEWSTIESLRHIVFVIDVWLGRTIKQETDPFHPIGLPPHFVPRVLSGSSIDADAAPTFDEASAVLGERLSIMDAFIEGLDAGELEREIGTHAQTVAGGLGVIFDELTFHNGFINRDLDEIEAAS